MMSGQRNKMKSWKQPAWARGSGVQNELEGVAVWTPAPLPDTPHAGRAAQSSPLTRQWKADMGQEARVRPGTPGKAPYHGFVGGPAALELEGPVGVRRLALRVLADRPLLGLSLRLFVLLPIFARRHTRQRGNVLVGELATATPGNEDPTVFRWHVFSLTRISLNRRAPPDHLTYAALPGAEAPLMVAVSR